MLLLGKEDESKAEALGREISKEGDGGDKSGRRVCSTGVKSIKLTVRCWIGSSSSANIGLMGKLTPNKRA